MTYEETLDYLYTTLPMFQRIGAAAYKDNLDNTIELCRVLGDPQSKFRSVHIAGTNGKGSSSHMIAAVLQKAGYRTGLYTSPHLKDFTERIRIDGIPVSRQFVIDFVANVKSQLEAIKPSFFETTVAMAFDYFAKSRVDIAVIEVGLGGRLDSTNVIMPEVSLITNIGYDHMDLLGDTLPKIAAEKAGIIKGGVPVVVSQRQPEVAEVFEKKALETGSQIVFGSDHFRMHSSGSGYGSFDVYRDEELVLGELSCELKGDYQRFNIPGVLETIDVLRHLGWSVSENQLRSGIRQVASITGLKGRWQKINDRPLTICDTGHNIDGVRLVMEQIAATPHDKLHIVWGMVRDKDIRPVLALLPADAAYYFCNAQIPRAMPAFELAAYAATRGLQGEVVEDVNEAIKRATARASSSDLILIGGSTFVVAEIDNL